jgi:exosome complex component RRP41
MALADAGLLMKDLVSAVSVGRVDDKIVVDLDYNEESYEDGPVADTPIAMIPRTGEITLLQMDGLVSKDDLKKSLEMAKKVCKDIYKIQEQALKAKYQKGVKNV